MASWEKDSKVARLSKRVNNLKRVTKGGQANILHALDMILTELPKDISRQSVAIMKSDITEWLSKIDKVVKDIDEMYEYIKQHDPEYKPRWPPKKRKGK